MLKHLRPNVFTLKSLLHLGQNVITCRTLLHLGSFITLGEREVKDSRLSGMSQSCFFPWDACGIPTVKIRFVPKIAKPANRIA